MPDNNLSLSFVGDGKRLGPNYIIRALLGAGYILRAILADLNYGLIPQFTPKGSSGLRPRHEGREAWRRLFLKVGGGADTVAP